MNLENNQQSPTVQLVLTQIWYNIYGNNRRNITSTVSQIYYRRFPAVVTVIIRESGVGRRVMTDTGHSSSTAHASRGSGSGSRQTVWPPGLWWTRQHQQQTVTVIVSTLLPGHALPSHKHQPSLSLICVLFFKFNNAFNMQISHMAWGRWIFVLIQISFFGGPKFCFLIIQNEGVCIYIVIVKMELKSTK